jgi:NADH:ubiquinone oxidoreductase subunit 5 (subunit L)/multisubunit Na+/H+ antiporter MnhA subunit
MLLLMPENHLIIGYGLLAVSVISGIYGVLLATIQHNMKKLLAYHSIENIGIIGIGIGVGAIGTGINNQYLAFAGYAGALLHTLNHSLFKSLLFFSAGSVYKATHILNIERLGGIIKKMPHTAILFLVAALAICGLPPFNGFISEFLIYSGLFHAIVIGQSAPVIILAVAGLALIGGLAMMCFTKAFGIIFLGNARQPAEGIIKEEGISALFPKYMIAFFILVIGLFPLVFIRVLKKPVEMFASIPAAQDFSEITHLMQRISLSLAGLVLLVLLLFFIRKIITRYTISKEGATWACGYEGTSPKLQYTGSSFVRSYAKLVRPLLRINKTRDEIVEIIPEPLKPVTITYDKIESALVDWPVRNLKAFLGWFKFLQNGSVQFYVLYGVVFISIAIIIPLLINIIQNIAQMLKQL